MLPSPSSMDMKSPASDRVMRVYSNILRHRGGSCIIARQKVVLQMVLKSLLNVSGGAEC